MPPLGQPSNCVDHAQVDVEGAGTGVLDVELSVSDGHIQFDLGIEFAHVFWCFEREEEWC